MRDHALTGHELVPLDDVLPKRIIQVRNLLILFLHAGDLFFFARGDPGIRVVHPQARDIVFDQEGKVKQVFHRLAKTLRIADEFVQRHGRTNFHQSHPNLDDVLTRLILALLDITLLQHLGLLMRNLAVRFLFVLNSPSHLPDFVLRAQRPEPVVGCLFL